MFRNREPHRGVPLIRSPADDPDESAADTLAAIHEHGPELLNRFPVLADQVLWVRFE